VDEKGEETVRSQPFYNLGVFVESEPQDMYAALDEALGESEIEGPPKRFEYRTISVMPHVLQLSIQRIRWNGLSQEKIGYQLPLEERIYLDRYMADERMLKKRRVAWDLSSQRRQLKARQRMLTSNDLNMDYSSVLENTSEYLRNINEHSEDLEVDQASQDVLTGLDNIARDVQSEISDIEQKVKKIDAKLSDIFDNRGTLSYRLHAVFIHVGDRATAGHWYVYIHDPSTNIWRQYNDERVTIVTDINLILRPSVGQNRNATSAVVIYVRESEQDKLIQTVCRSPISVEIVSEDVPAPEPVEILGGLTSSEVKAIEGTFQELIRMS